MASDWDPGDFEDRYRKRLQKVVRDKKKGRTVKVPEPVDEPAPVADLMAALEESLKAASGKGGAKRSRGGGSAKRRTKAKAKS